MKTIVLAITTLFLTSFSVDHSDSKDKYIIPKDTKKAAVIINEAFATTFKKLKFKVTPKQIKYANLKEFQKLIQAHPDIPKNHKERLFKDFGDVRDFRATIIDFSDFKPCEGENNFTAIVEAGSVETRVAYVYSTCGVLRCVINGYDPYNPYACIGGVGDIKRVQLCTESSDLCCVYYYCVDNNCPTVNCMEKNDCPNCN